MVLATASYFQLRQVRPFSNAIVHNSSNLVIRQRLSSATSALDADLERYLVNRGAEYRDSVQNDLQEMTDSLALLQRDPIEDTTATLSELETTIASLKEKITTMLETKSEDLSSADLNRLIVKVYDDIDLAKTLQSELSAKTLTSLQDTAQTQGSIADNVLRQSVILGIVVSLITVVTTILTDRRLRTISSLTNTAVAISEGDLSRIAPVEPCFLNRIQPDSGAGIIHPKAETLPREKGDCLRIGVAIPVKSRLFAPAHQIGISPGRAGSMVRIRDGFGAS